MKKRITQARLFLPIHAIVISLLVSCNNHDRGRLSESCLGVNTGELVQVKSSISVKREWLDSVVPAVRQGMTLAELVSLFGGQPYASYIDVHGSGEASWRFYIEDEEIKAVKREVFQAKFKKNHLIEGAVIPH